MKNCFHGLELPMILRMQSKSQSGEGSNYVEVP